MSPLRADAERTAHAILEAAERVLSADPAASMEQIAEQAGVARTTIHRRFATREALIEALAASAVRQIEEAVTAARPRTAPPLVAFHQGTANILGVKLAWRFAVTQILPGSPAARIQQRVIAEGDLVLQRLQQAGLIRADADLMWARRAYHGLLDAAISPDEAETDPDLLAARIVDTLLHGLGLPAARRPGTRSAPPRKPPSSHDPRPASTAFASPGRLVLYQRSRATDKSTSGCSVMARLSPSARNQAHARRVFPFSCDEERAVMPLTGTCGAARMRSVAHFLLRIQIARSASRVDYRLPASAPCCPGERRGDRGGALLAGERAARRDRRGVRATAARFARPVGRVGRVVISAALW